MSSPFKVGDIVKRAEGGPRMKVAAIDKADGRLRCTWISGPAKHSRIFEAEVLVSGMLPDMRRATRRP